MKTNEMKHTPGPWRFVPMSGVHGQSAIISDALAFAGESWPYHPRIVSVACMRGGPPREIADANARLIAAAPELLDQLRKAVSIIEYLYSLELIEAQHDETGRTWSGERKDMPEGYFEISNEAGVPPEEMNPKLEEMRSAIARATTPTTEGGL